MTNQISIVAPAATFERQQRDASAKGYRVIPETVRLTTGNEFPVCIALFEKAPDLWLVMSRCCRYHAIKLKCRHDKGDECQWSDCPLVRD